MYITTAFVTPRDPSRLLDGEPASWTKHEHGPLEQCSLLPAPRSWIFAANLPVLVISLDQWCKDFSIGNRGSQDLVIIGKFPVAPLAFANIFFDQKHGFANRAAEMGVRLPGVTQRPIALSPSDMETWDRQVSFAPEPRPGSTKHGTHSTSELGALFRTDMALLV